MGVVRLGDNGVDYYNSILALTDRRRLLRQAAPGAVRRIFSGAGLRAQRAALDEPAVLRFPQGIDAPAPLDAGGMHVAPSICYEDAFGSAQLALVARSDVLVNVTNDAWFGRSPARFQHLQISRMRAIEAGRFLLRAANDGVSAIIGPRGERAAVAPEYRAAVLRGTVVPRGGLSPYIRVGNWAVILLAFAAVAGSVRQRGAPLKFP